MSDAERKAKIRKGINKKKEEFTKKFEKAAEFGPDDGVKYK